MAGCSFDDDLELAFPLNGARNIVLVGRTGNGKSATGNSILGRKAFSSRTSSTGVTGTCELQRTVLKDGQILNIIDTPGLFDLSSKTEFIGREIVKCFEMAKDGIHAVILVFSIRSRFSQEELAALHTLQTLFESKILDYLIVVFTGGDELAENDETLDGYLGGECPDPLKEILLACKDRRVLFDNKTGDEIKKAEQLNQLLLLVDLVLEQNGGLPYTDEVFAELKKGAFELRLQKEEFNSLVAGCSNQNKEISELRDKMYRSYEEQRKRITETVESKLKESTGMLQQQLAEEQAARLKVEENARREAGEFRKRLEGELREAERHRKLAEKRAARSMAEKQEKREAQDLRNCLECARRDAERLRRPADRCPFL